MLDLLMMLGMTVSIVVLVGEPFVRRPRPSHADDPSASVRAGLLLQKDALYTAIRDVVFDFQTGKVDQQDYVELRQRLEREAVQVLRLLDTSDAGAAVDAALEQHIARLRQRPPGIAPVPPLARTRAVNNRA
jgi:hypothetical protein